MQKNSGWLKYRYLDDWYSSPNYTFTASTSTTTTTNIGVPAPTPEPREDTPLSWLDDRIEEVTKLAFA